MKWMRWPRWRRPALCWAMERAAVERSVAVMSAEGSLEARARAMAPVPVPTSRIRRGMRGAARCGRAAIQWRTASTRSSVSGRGMRVLAGDAEREAVELLHAGEVLEGFFGGAAGGESAEGGEEVGGKVGVGVGEEPGAVAEEEVDEEGFGVAAGDAGGGFGDGFAESHGQGIEGRG